MDLDTDIFERWRFYFRDEYEMTEKAKQERREIRWKQLEAAASKGTKSLPLPITTLTPILTPTPTPASTKALALSSQKPRYGM